MQTATAARRLAARHLGAARPPIRSLAAGARKINQPMPPHEPWVAPTLDAKDNTVDFGAISKSHWQPRGSWSAEEIRKAQHAHVVATWGPTNATANSPILVRGEGPYVYDIDGKKYHDWTSQAICVNMGHTVPPAVIEAVAAQMEELPHVYSGVGMYETRGRLSALMSQMLPGDINGFLFPCSGNEANEAAIRIARRYTGRKKVITQYRSYHGGSSTTLAATGDYRRWFDDGSSNGILKTFNPTPLNFSWGADPEEAVARSLALFEEQVMLEGPESIAAVLFESVVGSGGVLWAEPAYMCGIKAICDKYGILYIADEVMVGFGRTGHFWGFQHYPGLLPDIVTSAKGLSSSWQPISMVAMRQSIKDHFLETPLGWGSTFQAHPVSVACGYEALKHMVEQDVMGHVQKNLAPVMKEQTQRMLDNHPCVKAGRALGMFGCLDLQKPDGSYMQPANGPPHPALPLFKKALLDEGIYGFVRAPNFHSAPPLISTPEDLVDGYDKIDRALTVLDKGLGF